MAEGISTIRLKAMVEVWTKKFPKYYGTESHDWSPSGSSVLEDLPYE